MNWLNKNWKAILIGLNIPIALTFGVLFWKTIDNNEITSLANFNDFFSPLISFFGAIGVFLTLFYLSRQNKYLLSQNLKPHYDQRITRLEKEFEKESITPVHSKKEFISFFELFNQVKVVIVNIKINQRYRVDISEIKNGRKFDMTHIYGNAYFNDSHFLSEFFNRLTTQFWKVIDLTEDIKKSKLEPDEILLFRKRIKSEFVKDYMLLMEHEEEFLVPRINSGISLYEEVEFYDFFEDGRRSQFYEYFLKEFGSANEDVTQ